MTGLIGNLGLLALAAHGQTFWLPPQSSTGAHETDAAFYFVFWVCFFFFFLNIIWLAVFCIKYRKRPGHREEETPHHNYPLEIAWSVIPLAIVCYMFWIGFRGFLNQYDPPGDGMNVQVQAQKWQWTFIYPNGTVTSELHAPVGQNVILTMTSSDVIHSFFVPDFRIKKDVVPGRYHKLWFNAPQAGTHHIFCTEYCGTGHSSMLSKVVVEDQAAFKAWLKDQGEFDDKLAPKDAGERWYHTMGCEQCHSVTGVAGTGPSWKDLWGSTQTMSDGSTVTVDENYVRESILNPSAKIVKGFQNVMPSFQGRLEEKSIRSIIAYLKSLSDKTSPEELEEISKTPPQKGAGGAAQGAAGDADAAGGAAATQPAGSAGSGSAPPPAGNNQAAGGGQ
jgi:cytochrome c oxidase subunit 2